MKDQELERINNAIRFHMKFCVACEYSGNGFHGFKPKCREGKSIEDSWVDRCLDIQAGK